MVSLSNVLEEGKVGQQLGKSLRPNRVIFSFLSEAVDRNTSADVSSDIDCLPSNYIGNCCGPDIYIYI